MNCARACNFIITIGSFCAIFKVVIPLRHIMVLLCLFAVTLAIRWPNLGRPMSKHHEFCTATALRVLTVWHQEGIGSVGYNPATNFAGAANKHINNHASGSGKMVDVEGNYYYVSHPPLAYYLPYAVFSLLHIEPDVLPLQYFNLFINLLCGFGIYLLARAWLPGNSWVGMVAAIVYWFTPAALWFQSNVYMSDMMGQPFYIAALLLAIKVKDNPRLVTITALAIVCFLGTYNTWFGVLVALSLGLYFLFKAINNRAFIWVTLLLVLSQLLAMGLMAWQYSYIAGWDAYLAELSHRFTLRGSAPNDMLGMSLSLLVNYFVNYGALWALLPVGLLIKRPKGTRAMAIISVLPIALMHLLLLNYTGHDFTTLYAAVPISLFIAMLTVGHNRIYKGLTVVVLVVAIVSGFMFYKIVNPYGQFSFYGDRYITFQHQAEQIAAQPHQAVIFSLNTSVSPEALWYAKRNVLRVADEQAAMDFLQQRNISTGVIFEHSRNEGFQKTKTIYLQSDKP